MTPKGYKKVYIVELFHDLVEKSFSEYLDLRWIPTMKLRNDAFTKEIYQATHFTLKGDAEGARVLFLNLVLPFIEDRKAYAEKLTVREHYLKEV